MQRDRGDIEDLLKRVFRYRTPVIVAREMEISYHTVLSWKNRDRLPSTEMVKKLREKYIQKEQE